MPKITKDNTKEINGLTTNIAVILNKVEYIEKEVGNINTKLEKDYVTQDQFAPISKLVYGLTATILLAVVGAVIAGVLK